MAEMIDTIVVEDVVIALDSQGAEYVMSVRDDGLGWNAADEQVHAPTPGSAW